MCQPVRHDTRRHLYDPQNHILPTMDHSTVSLQMGTNKCASQVGMTAPGTRRHIYDTKLGTGKCDNSSMSLQMGYTRGAHQSGQVFGLGWQIYDPKYCPQGQWLMGLQQLLEMAQAQESPQSALPTTRRRQAAEIPVRAVSPHHRPIWVFESYCVSCLVFLHV